MRTLAIGDIHGCYAALRALEEFVPFRDEDRIVALGDFIDRGPQSYEVVEWLIARGARLGPAGLIPILGNHEELLFTSRGDPIMRHAWESACGGWQTLESYRSAGADDPDSPMGVPPAHWQFFKSCANYFETGSHIYVHASLDPDLPLAMQPREALRWIRFGELPPHFSGKTVICGHTPQPERRPTSIGHAICIDTGVYANDGWLTCFDAETGEYWQANYPGTETRRGSL
ncbi:MAG: metallophosphoesterase family protein [Verrucomicrobiales bacterium]